MADVLGFAFPFRIDPAAGGVARAADRDKLRQNIRAILGTRYGERVMLRDYGTRLHSLVHDPNDEALAVLARKQIQEALVAWEPRILVTNVTVERREGEMQIRIDYAHTSEPVTDSLLVPLG
jgi:phage baseplate assembly protein W